MKKKDQNTSNRLSARRSGISWVAAAAATLTGYAYAKTRAAQRDLFIAEVKVFLGSRPTFKTTEGSSYLQVTTFRVHRSLLSVHVKITFTLAPAPQAIDFDSLAVQNAQWRRIEHGVNTGTIYTYTFSANTPRDSFQNDLQGFLSAMRHAPASFEMVPATAFNQPA